MASNNTVQAASIEMRMTTLGRHLGLVAEPSFSDAERAKHLAILLQAARGIETDLLSLARDVYEIPEADLYGAGEGPQSG